VFSLDYFARRVFFKYELLDKYRQKLIRQFKKERNRVVVNKHFIVLVIFLFMKGVDGVLWSNQKVVVNLKSIFSDNRECSGLLNWTQKDFHTSMQNICVYDCEY